MPRAGAGALALVLPAAMLAWATLVSAQHPVCPDVVRPGVDLVDAGSQRLRAAQLAGQAPLQSLTIRRPSLERKVPLCAATSMGADSGGTATAAARLPGMARGDAAVGATPDDAPLAAGRSWRLEALPVRLRTLYNSAYPLDVNTGAVWAGAGVSSSLELGGELVVGPVTASLYPLVAFQQNSEFPIRETARRGGSRYEYAGHVNIDWPQRHGDDAFWTMHPGQSSVRVEGWSMAIGFSTENLWIGPAQRAPLMMSSTAPGFPHAFLSTTAPLRTPVGTFEAQLFWGRLRESGEFDNVPENDHQLLVGTTVVWGPSFLPGLYLGAHRSYLSMWDNPEWGFLDYIRTPFQDVRGNPLGDNRLMSLFGRWALPAAEFEVYGEWGREDGWGDWADLLRELDHSQAFMLGLQKLTRRGDHAWRWWAELANLQHSVVVRGGRGTQTFYIHSEMQQGYTHRGQLLGAWIGPGSNSQLIGVDRVRGDRLSGIAIERVRHDADAYYDQWARFYGETGHDASLSLWLRHVDAVGPLQLSATAAVTRRQNRHFIYFTGAQPPDLRWETNAHLDLEVRWLPGR